MGCEYGLRVTLSVNGELIIGIDFDNTIICYDDVLYSVALARGLIGAAIKKGKTEIRDTVRRLPDGENEWQKLQAAVYGPEIKQANLADGVTEFFEICKRHGLKRYIVSHKTQYAAADLTVNLRESATSWMRKRGFFEQDGFGFSEGDVFFTNTRAEKIRCIVELGCTHFIDDLEDVFLDESFPEDVTKLLYCEDRSLSLQGTSVFRSWRELNEYFGNKISCSSN